MTIWCTLLANLILFEFPHCRRTVPNWYSFPTSYFFLTVISKNEQIGLLLQVVMSFRNYKAFVKFSIWIWKKLKFERICSEVLLLKINLKFYESSRSVSQVLTKWTFNWDKYTEKVQCFDVKIEHKAATWM